jgi:cyclohexyl-isocyanide hydratase
MMPLTIGMLLYPRLTQLDLTGPLEVLARINNARIHLIWKDTAPVVSDLGMAILPTTTFHDCPQLDVLLVPGGPGQVVLMDDPEVIGFLARQGQGAQYVTSVCTGSLLLGAAGLLKGYKAACHWTARDQLSLLGAEPVNERIVIDRNRITGGGVTAGIDFALKLVAILRDETEARRIQLQIEYNPAPPFQSGSPETAEPGLVARVLELGASLREGRLAATRRAQARLETDEEL